MSAQKRLATIKDHISPMSTQKKSPITCHVLVASQGKPGKNVQVKLEKIGSNGAFNILSTSQTNDDGRCPDLLPGDYKVERGVYRITFETQAFFDSIGEKCFYPYVQIVFALDHPEQHYHIPLLLSPYSYTTYRGS